MHALGQICGFPAVPITLGDGLSMVDGSKMVDGLTIVDGSTMVSFAQTMIHLLNDYDYTKRKMNRRARVGRR